MSGSCFLSGAHEKNWIACICCCTTGSIVVVAIVRMRLGSKAEDLVSSTPGLVHLRKLYSLYIVVRIYVMWIDLSFGPTQLPLNHSIGEKSSKSKQRSLDPTTSAMPAPC